MFVIVIAYFVIISNRRKDEAIPLPIPSVSSNSISDGLLTIPYDKNFALATNPEQILVKTYIPPCLPGFNYCLYLHADTYKGTNFESAGVAITKKPDMGTERLCLNTPPRGYSDVLPDHTGGTDATAYSVFENISDAAAGHYANGNLYRLFLRKENICYEVETQIGQSRFENYPAGSIKQFSKTDEGVVKDQLEGIIEAITYQGRHGLFYSED